MSVFMLCLCARKYVHHLMYRNIRYICWAWVMFMVLIPAFSNSIAISWRSDLLMKETVVQKSIIYLESQYMSQQ